MLHYTANETFDDDKKDIPVACTAKAINHLCFKTCWNAIFHNSSTRFERRLNLWPNFYEGHEIVSRRFSHIWNRFFTNNIKRRTQASFVVANYYWKHNLSLFFVNCCEINRSNYLESLDAFLLYTKAQTSCFEWWENMMKLGALWWSKSNSSKVIYQMIAFYSQFYLLEIY